MRMVGWALGLALAFAIAFITGATPLVGFLLGFSLTGIGVLLGMSVEQR